MRLDLLFNIDKELRFGPYRFICFRIGVVIFTTCRICKFFPRACCPYQFFVCFQDVRLLPNRCFRLLVEPILSTFFSERCKWVALQMLKTESTKIITLLQAHEGGGRDHLQLRPGPREGAKRRRMIRRQRFSPSPSCSVQTSLGSTAIAAGGGIGGPVLAAG
jgi:hypothetical protein